MDYQGPLLAAAGFGAVAAYFAMKPAVPVEL
jgi:hypothetical protein